MQTQSIDIERQAFYYEMNTTSQSHSLRLLNTFIYQHKTVDLKSTLSQCMQISTIYLCGNFDSKIIGKKILRLRGIAIFFKRNEKPNYKSCRTNKRIITKSGKKLPQTEMKSEEEKNCLRLPHISFLIFFRFASYFHPYFSTFDFVYA